MHVKRQKNKVQSSSQKKKWLPIIALIIIVFVYYGNTLSLKTLRLDKILKFYKSITICTENNQNGQFNGRTTVCCTEGFSSDEFIRR